FEALRVRLCPAGIAVTIVRPGVVDTGMTAGAGRLPLVLSAERAAVIIRRGLERGRAVIDFPWPAALAMRLVARLPSGLFDWLVGRIPHREDREAAGRDDRGGGRGGRTAHRGAGSGHYGPRRRAGGRPGRVPGDGAGRVPRRLGRGERAD